MEDRSSHLQRPAGIERTRRVLHACQGTYLRWLKENVTDSLRTRVGPRRNDANYRVLKEDDLLTS